MAPKAFSDESVGQQPTFAFWSQVYLTCMGYILVIIAAVILVPLVYLVFTRRAGGAEGQRPIGKPVMVTEPAADEATPAASAVRKDSAEAQRRTPAA